MRSFCVGFGRMFLHARCTWRLLVSFFTLRLYTVCTWALILLTSLTGVAARLWRVSRKTVTIDVDGSVGKFHFKIKDCLVSTIRKNCLTVSRDKFSHIRRIHLDGWICTATLGQSFLHGFPHFHHSITALLIDQTESTESRFNISGSFIFGVIHHMFIAWVTL